jgi:hypothetical protein
MNRIQVTKNFHSGELMCPCCEALIYDQRTIDFLQISRDIVGRPFVINSFYRCRIHNDDTGGSPKSQHLLGKAADISTRGWTGNDIWVMASTIQTYRFSVIIYQLHIHVDNRIGKPIFGWGDYP